MATIISREPVRAQVRRILLKRLLSGELEPGSRINESELARELGVSRTPLRETLINLEFEGFIEGVQGQGFSVAPLKAKVALDLHSLVGHLEGLAVRSLGTISVDELSKLLANMGRIDRDLARAAKKNDLEKVIKLGDLWHATLVSHSENEQLHEILSLLKKRLYRYTYHFVEDFHRVEGTLNHHKEIAAALRKGDIDMAVRLVYEHWMTGVDSRYDWLADGG